MSFNDLTNMTFGRLTVVCRDTEREIFEYEKSKRRRVYWDCVCICGNRVTVLGDNLKRGKQVSCGCLKRGELSKRQSTHKMTNEKLYFVWCGIKARCYNANTLHFDRYGGRGITMCDEWKNDFSVFYGWAIQSGYKEGLSIDRVDNDGGYSPENCRWVDMSTQSNNRCNNIIVSVDGEAHTLMQWSQLTGIKYKTLHNAYRSGKDMPNYIKNKLNNKT